MQCENKSYIYISLKNSSLEEKENTLNEKQYAQQMWSNKMWMLIFLLG